MSPEQRQIAFEAPAGACGILLVRHGESAAAIEGQPFDLVGGHGDPPLHPDGEIQAERVGERLAGEPLAALYVTTLRRTVQTAAPLAARLGLTPVVEPDLREVLLGEWEGGVYRHRVAEGHPIAAQVVEQQRWDVIPGAERKDHFDGRVWRALTRIVDRHRGETVAVFTHGGVIGSILAQATAAAPFTFVAADNASVSHLVVDGRRSVLRRFNDVAHLRSGFVAR